jgi:hypothetical protein
MNRVPGLWLVIAALVAGTPAAADFYRYTDDSGVVHFTNDIERIPAHLRSGATHIPAAESGAPSVSSGQTAVSVPIRRSSPPPARKTPQRLLDARQELNQSYRDLTERKKEVVAEKVGIRRHPRKRSRKLHRVANRKILDLNQEIAQFENRRQAYNREGGSWGLASVPELEPIPYPYPLTGQTAD